MQPGIINIYRLGGEINKTYRLEFASYNLNPVCRVRETCIQSLEINDINHWKEYAEDNFVKLDNGYYEIRNFGKFQRYLDKAKEQPTLKERFNSLPGLAKFLLIGVLLILLGSLYQQVTNPQSAQQNTEQR